MIRFRATIQKFGKQAEKSGWTHVIIPAAIAGKLKQDYKRSFRVRGKLDAHPVQGVALLPMGGGDFVLPLNAAMRKATGKGPGSTLALELEEDTAQPQPSPAFLECLEDDPAAGAWFFSLPRGHQNYFIKWIGAAKTAGTEAARIAQALNALSLKMDFGSMLRAIRKERSGLR